MQTTERLTPTLSAVACKPGSGFFDGYIACSCATAAFGVVLLGCYSDVQTRMEATQAVFHAIQVTLATVLVVITVMFELAERVRNRIAAPLSLSAVVGLAAVAPAMLLLELHPLIPKAAILLVSLRLVRLLAQEANWRRALAPLLSGAVIGYWTFLLSFVDGYKTPWVNEATMFGQVHVDLLFHSAIVNMLRLYSVGSIGVDGAIPFPYYFGSHRIVEALSGILDIQPLTFYSVVFPLLLGPLFLAMFFFFAVSFQTFLLNREYFNRDSPSLRSELFWLVSAIVFIGIFPVEFRRNLGLFDNVFHSESFGIGVLVAYLPGVFFFEYIGRRSHMRLSVVWMILGGVYLAGLCMVKFSVASVLAGTAAYLLLRLKLAWRHRLFGFLTITMPLGYGLWITRGSPSGDSGPSVMEMIKPFAFLRDLIEPRLWVVSFVAFFGPFILFVLLRLMLPRTSTRKTWPARFRALEFLDLEVLSVLLTISVIPSLVISVPQGSTNFFSEVSYWFVLPMLSVVLSDRLRK